MNGLLRTGIRKKSLSTKDTKEWTITLRISARKAFLFYTAAKGWNAGFYRPADGYTGPTALRQVGMKKSITVMWTDL